MSTDQGFLKAFVDGSMSRNNAETLAAEILERIGKGRAK